MKYIKKYEDLKEPKYKIGDYVLLDNSKIENCYEMEDAFGTYWKNRKIITNIYEYNPNEQYPYYVRNIFDENKFTSVSEEEIEKKISEEEVKLIKATNKYNI